MRITRLAFATLLTAVALSALTTASASASHPLILTQSGKELLFNAEGGRFLQIFLSRPQFNVTETDSVTCEKTSGHGSFLQKTPLVHLNQLTFEGKCELTTMNFGKSFCTEPIRVKALLGELGLASATNKKVDMLLTSFLGTEIGKLECGNHSYTLEGSVIAELPEVNAKGVGQYNKQLTEVELTLESESKNENQKITEIFLLGAQRSKAELFVAGLFGGKASWETSPTLKPDGSIEISTTQ